MSTSDGPCGEPLRSSPWQLAQFDPYNDLSLRGTSRWYQGISFSFTYRRPVVGSNAGPPHSPPPSTPGKMIVPCRLGGSYMPEVLYSRNILSAAACASGVRAVIMLSSSVCRVKGGGLVGTGWSSAVFSPGIADEGTLRYSIGKSDRPVSRSRT